MNEFTNLQDYRAQAFIFPHYCPTFLLHSLENSKVISPALSVVTDAAKSNVPALGYTGAYAFANVILTLAGTLIMLV